MKVALVTPCVPHLPFHPSCSLGYGAAILTKRHDLEVIDLNADMYFKNRAKLRPILDGMDNARTVSDVLDLYPFYDEVETQINSQYAAIRWHKYSLVYVTLPSWFPTVRTESVLRLTRAITRVSPSTRVFFFGNSLGSWTNEGQLKRHGVQTVHLNDLFAADGTARPVRYDLLPPPVYQHRGKYLFDLLPFMLKHGCPWGRCRFCSLSRGWNSGYLERSAKAVIDELEALIDQYDPAVLVCRDNSLNGRNLIQFCGYFKSFGRPWGGMSRADLTGKQIDSLRTAGCKLIFFGLESGSDRTLRVFNKGITTKQMSDFIKTSHSCGILPAPSILIGAPGERRVDFEKTLQFLVDHRQYFDFVNVYPFMVSPASEFGSQKRLPDKNTPTRLLRLIQICQDLGLKVCVGEQCVEYVLFKWVCKGRLALS